MLREKCVLLDLDNTLIPYGNPTWSYDWVGYDCSKDVVNPAVATLINLLYPTHKILIVTARPWIVRQGTIDMLQHHIQYDDIYTRLEGEPDSHHHGMPAHEYKLRCIQKIIKNHGPIAMAFEDNLDVINMYKEHGIFTFMPIAR